MHLMQWNAELSYLFASRSIAVISQPQSSTKEVEGMAKAWITVISRPQFFGIYILDLYWNKYGNCLWELPAWEAMILHAMYVGDIAVDQSLVFNRHARSTLKNMPVLPLCTSIYCWLSAALFFCCTASKQRVTPLACAVYKLLLHAIWCCFACLMFVT